MAYTSDEWELVIRGMTGPSEEWANVWCFSGTTDLGEVQDVVDAFHAFHSAIGEIQSAQYTATQARVRNLLSGAIPVVSWATVTGGSSSQLLPTQLAIRLSLDDGAGHRGGPFLGGWQEGNNADNGLFQTTHRDLVADAVEDLAGAIVTAGGLLALNRPSVGTTVGVLHARVGRRFDVIRKRSNDTPEEYATRLVA